MMHKRLLVLTVTFGILLLLSPRLSAQTAGGAILGTVRDPAGAHVPGASVTVRELSTNMLRLTTTNSVGTYFVGGLPPGNYEINVQANGFKAFKRTGIVLEVRQYARIDMTLELGSVNQTVEVSGHSPLLDTTTSTQGTVIRNTQIVDLPLNDRDFTTLAGLSPGVLVNGAYKVQGNQAFKNNFTWDGISDVHALTVGVAATPSIDAIDEFDVETGSFGAQYGEFGTSQVHIVAKRGTNNFHGTLFEFLRNDDLDARSFFAHSKESLKRSDFGLDVGGPIVRDKLFFLFNWESLRTRSDQFSIATVPTMAMRNGDLSALKPIYDPETTTATGQRSQFLGNVIPTDRIDPAAKNILNLMVPLPTNSAFPFNFDRVDSLTNDSDQYMGRVDFNVSARHSLFGEFFREDTQSLGSRITPTSFQGITRFPEYRAVFGDTLTITPTLLNQLRIGYHRDVSVLTDNTPDLFPKLGIQGITVPGAPLLSMSDIGYFGQWGYPYILPHNVVQLSDTVTFTRGRHTLETGADIQRFEWNRTRQPFGRPTYTFNGFATQNPSSPGGTGSGFADFLLGLPFAISATQGFQADYVRATYFGGYVQDNWRVTDRLSLNLGLRYDLVTRPHEKYNRWTNFDPAVGKAVAASGPQGQLAPGIIPQAAANFASLYVPASDTSLPLRTLAIGDHNNFAPRFGFAWTPPHLKKTVVRGGIGIYYDITNGNYEFNKTGNFLWSIPESFSTSNELAPSLSLDNPFAQGGNLPGIVAPPFVNPQKRDPYIEQWSFDIQHSLSSQWMVDVGYSGSVGKKLEVAYPYNQPSAGPGPIQPRRPFPQFANFFINDGSGSSNYNALQISVKNRFSKSLTFLGSYTYSKELNDMADYEIYANDPQNRNADWGPDFYDVPQLLSIGWVYRLPFGSGEHWLRRGGIANQVLGGWKISGILTYQSGFPVTPIIYGDIANVGQGSMRPDRIGSGKVAHPTLGEWFDPTAFKVPAQYTWGNSGKGILRGPNFKNLDFGVYKEFRGLREGQRLQFRTEFYNLTNTPSFGLPNAAINIPGAGAITSTVGAPREIQFALKYMF